MAAGTSLQAVAALLDLLAQVKRPLRIGTWSIQDSCDIIVKDHRGKETNVDVAGKLKDVVVLPSK
jgi:hypothetical protein